ncbi:MAG: AraC family transcriptional regulator [Deltaproteobacteria bacterium]|nr:AraC family transcriptional regulator [Deltaproteobacteria bacterium]
MIGTFLASEVRILCRLLDSYQIDGFELLRQAGLNSALIEEPRARFPFDRVAIAWKRAVQLTGKSHLGLGAVKFYRATDFHGLAVVFLASQNLRTALERLVRYHVVINSALSMRLERHSDGLDLLCTTVRVEDDAQCVMEDVRAAILVDLCRTGADGALNPIEVAFTYTVREDPAEHTALFGCPVVFGAPQWRISFALDDVDRPFLASNRELARSNDEVLDRMVKSLREDDLISHVKRAMIDELPSGTPAEDVIAKAVSMSTRSLQRRLAEERTSFTELLAVVRRELAEQYVLNPQIPVTEISYMLGFSEVSAFSRAFKRWTGRSPVTSRQQSLAH